MAIKTAPQHQNKNLVIRLHTKIGKERFEEVATACNVSRFIVPLQALEMAAPGLERLFEKHANLAVLGFAWGVKNDWRAAEEGKNIIFLIKDRN